MNQPEPSVALEILSCLRGRRTAANFSQKLGFKSNQANRWLSGHSVFSWADLIETCDTLKIPVKKRLRQSAVFTGDPGELKSLLSHFCPLGTQAWFAKQMKVSPSTLSKWFNGVSSPPADDIFSLVRGSAYSFAEFLQAFLPEKVESETLARILAAQRLDYERLVTSPWLLSLLSIIKTPEFSGEKERLSELLATKLDFPEAEMRLVLDSLKKKRVLEWSEKKARYVVNMSGEIMDLTSQKDLMRSFIRFWTIYALAEVTKTPLPDDNMNRGAFVNLPLSANGLVEAQKALVAFVQKLNSLAENENPERVFCLSVLFADAATPTLGRRRNHQ